MQERIPKYFALKKKLIQMIDSGEFQEEEQIPSERELIEQYQISRITVRKAIDELVNEGYLYRVQGKGTYVKGDEYSQDLFSIASCTDDVTRFGMRPAKRLINASYVEADSKRCRYLNLTKGESLFRLERVQLADDETLNYTVTYLPEKIVPCIHKYDFEQKSLYSVIENEYGIKITKATRTFEAILAKDEIAEYLGVEEGMPIILFGCVTCGIVNGKEIPIETFKCYYRTDKFKFYINQIR